MSKIAKKLCKTVAVIAFLMYACLVVGKQEIAFQKYETEMKEYERLIEEEELRKEELIITKNQISSREYIEEIARDKLGFVMPNEIIFVDASL